MKDSKDAGVEIIRLRLMENEWCINNYAAAIMAIEKLNFNTLQLAVVIAYI